MLDRSMGSISGPSRETWAICSLGPGTGATPARRRPELPGYALERDAALLQKLDDVATQAPKLLEKLDELGKRPILLAQEFERNYLEALITELDYVEISIRRAGRPILRWPISR